MFSVFKIVTYCGTHRSGKIYVLLNGGNIKNKLPFINEGLKITETCLGSVGTRMEPLWKKVFLEVLSMTVLYREICSV